MNRFVCCRWTVTVCCYYIKRIKSNQIKPTRVYVLLWEELYVYWIQQDSPRNVYILIVVVVVAAAAAASSSSSSSSLSLLFSFFLFLCHSFYNYLILNWREKRLILWEELYVYWIWQDVHRNLYIYILFCLRTLDACFVDLSPSVDCFFVRGSRSRSRSNIDPTKSNNTCTSASLGGHHLLLSLTLIWLPIVLIF